MPWREEDLGPSELPRFTEMSLVADTERFLVRQHQSGQGGEVLCSHQAAQIGMIK